MKIVMSDIALLVKGTSEKVHTVETEGKLLRFLVYLSWIFFFLHLLYLTSDWISPELDHVQKHHHQILV